MLVSHAVRHKDVTYTNVSSAPHTRPIIEAQGFSRYSEGIFVAVPALQGPFGDPAVEVFDARQQPRVDFDPCDQEILQRARGARLHQPVVRDFGTRLSLCVSPTAGQTLRALRATDLLP